MLDDPIPDHQDFLDAFETSDIPAGQFRHRDHVRVAWLMLKQGPLEEVLARFTQGLRRFAAAKGADGLYHHTITWTYLFAIHERMLAMHGGHDWAAFHKTHPDLFEDHRRFLGRYFTDEVLDSDLARRTFLLPDRGARHAA